MNFFERQAQARQWSRRWVALFVLAVLAIVVAVDGVVLFLLVTFREPALNRELDGTSIGFDGTALWISSVAVLLIVGIASLYKTAMLSAGGSAVAMSAGGTRIARDTGDPSCKRLRNIVEEMAIASGVPVPQIYVLEQESGINAFAAGHAPSNAAIAVTRGALEHLERAELQGVIAHEFSHILNGDMRLNIRLMGMLFGIQAIALIGRLLLHVRGGRRGGKGVMAVMLSGAALLAIGYIGLFFGRLIQAAVSRHRERLADASAVQFTREPQGLRNALVKIGAWWGGSRMSTADTEAVAHMLFAAGLRSYFATHPPLVERIRALDPSFRETEFDTVRARMTAKANTAEDEYQDEDDTDRTNATDATARLNDLLRTGVQVSTAHMDRLVGNPGEAELQWAHRLRVSLPMSIEQAAAEPAAAKGLLFALVLQEGDKERDVDGGNGDVRTYQLRFIRKQLGDATADAVQQVLPQIQTLAEMQRQPLLLQLIPTLRQLPRQERFALLTCLNALLQRTGRIDVSNYALRKLARLYLHEGLAPASFPGRALLRAHSDEVVFLFGVLARAGHETESEAEQAYRAGLSELFPQAHPEYRVPADWARRLDFALDKLDRLRPSEKARLLHAMVRTVSHDGHLAVQEAELLRAVCASLHCPLPPLWAQAHVPS